MSIFRRGIGNTKANTKLDVENMNVTNVSSLGVVSSGKPSRTTKETARYRFSSSQ